MCVFLFRDGKVLSLTITKGSRTKGSIKLVDSYNILAKSLEDLCRDYKTEVVKDIFPYTFVTRHTLFYRGDKPSRSHYKDISIERYDAIPSLDWDTKDETVKYLEQDLKSLFEVMDKFSVYMFTKYGIQVSESLTISSVAMKLYLSKFYKEGIPLIRKPSVYNAIKESYFGGNTEVYKPTNTKGELLYYYDVNSLYPYVALNDMPGRQCTLESSINKVFTGDLDIFGFFYCNIKVSEEGLYLGLLPVRSKDGISMPIGEWQGWYFSEELRFAAQHGYEIRVLSGFKFNRESDVFTAYVNEIYGIKSTTTNPTEKATSKSLLNNLLGRFGLNIYKGVTRLIDMKTGDFNKIVQTKALDSFMPLGDDYAIISYVNIVSAEVAQDFEVDFSKAVIDSIESKDGGEKTFDDVSIAIASAVTAYARVVMSKVKLDILKNGGSIYYTDTDSIVTDKPLPESMVGNNLGQFKLEHIADLGYFISNKTYFLQLKDGGTVARAKGTTGSYLNKDSYIQLYSGKDLDTITTKSNRNIGQGYVNIINDHKVTISWDAFKKREKVYVNGVWVDTKPLVYQADSSSSSCVEGPDTSQEDSGTDTLE